MPHPGINDEDLALGNANFEIADLISVSVPKPCIEGVAVLWEKRADILHGSIQNLFLRKFNYLLSQKQIKVNQVAGSQSSL